MEKKTAQNSDPHFLWFRLNKRVQHRPALSYTAERSVQPFTEGGLDLRTPAVVWNTPSPALDFSSLSLSGSLSSPVAHGGITEQTPAKPVS